MANLGCDEATGEVALSNSGGSPGPLGSFETATPQTGKAFVCTSVLFHSLAAKEKRKREEQEQAKDFCFWGKKKNKTGKKKKKRRKEKTKEKKREEVGGQGNLLGRPEIRRLGQLCDPAKPSALLYGPSSLIYSYPRLATRPKTGALLRPTSTAPARTASVRSQEVPRAFNTSSGRQILGKESLCRRNRRPTAHGHPNAYTRSRAAALRPALQPENVVASTSQREIGGR